MRKLWKLSVAMSRVSSSNHHKMASVLHFSVFLFLVCALGIGANVTSSSCPSGWTRQGSRCFTFHRGSMDWATAELTCVRKGGNLASIHNQREQNFITQLIRKLSGENTKTWIGGYDAVKEGLWLWSDGSTFNYKGWKKGQPDKHVPPEHCAETNFKGAFWNNASCKVKRSFLCVKNL
ncbi:galactose-specific lectin nattectin-like [Thalassophryne amazonica]|uniref:galactose-specific lectin nattectin-like n=1 Tax=Thalassophryne amazonica TaxID=390379 RepID=UPI001471EEC0|nr:galactose-specific lectin nattectin-like [Thalassophryne amazonica]